MIYDIKYFSTITFIMSLTLSLARMWVGHQHFWDFVDITFWNSLIMTLFFFFYIFYLGRFVGPDFGYFEPDLEFLD